MMTRSWLAEAAHAAAARAPAARRRLRGRLAFSTAGDPAAPSHRADDDATPTVAAHGAKLAYEPELVPSRERMRLEGIDVLEE